MIDYQQWWRRIDSIGGKEESVAEKNRSITIDGSGEESIDFYQRRIRIDRFLSTSIGGGEELIDYHRRRMISIYGSQVCLYISEPQFTLTLHKRSPCVIFR
jgi:hypothetical protein